MARMKSSSYSTWRYILPGVLATLLIMAAIGFLFYSGEDKSNEQPSPQLTPAPEKQEKRVKETPSETAEQTIFEAKITEEPDIDYKNLDKDKELKDLMGKRKEDFRIKESLDMIVKADEEFKVGDVKVSMGEILKKTFMEKGEVFEESIKNSGEVVPASNRHYGIYVVQPGDNIWNIHFNIIKEYYDSKGISVEPLADEPNRKGFSSGVGKILKFSEKMVTIYNLKKERIDTHIDLIQPLSKIVVYNMSEIFSLLDEINYKNVDKIQFDGRAIWIATDKP